jgi:hypothetical protein
MHISVQVQPQLDNPLIANIPLIEGGRWMIYSFDENKTSGKKRSRENISIIADSNYLRR